MTRARGFFLASALCLIAIKPLPAEGAGGIEKSQPIQVRIENATGEQLRCVAVLAHFVTRTLPPIPGAGTLQVTLERDATAGSLSYGSHGEHPMMLENLLCGTESDWSATSRDLPILPMRSDKARKYSYSCGLLRAVVNCALQ